MNYIELVNWFWELDESWQFSCCETRLYFYLLKTANRLGWENSWTHSDDKTSANVGVSAKTMQSARNRLVQSGLISFLAGGKGQRNKGRYQISLPFSDKKELRSEILRPKGIPNGIPKGIPNGGPNGIPTPYIEDKLNKSSSTGKKTFSEKKSEEKNPELPLPSAAPGSDSNDLAEEVRQFFNEHCKSLKPVKSLTSLRRAAIMGIFHAHGRDAIFEALKNAGRSKFLAGENESGWVAGFNWIFEHENFVKVYEGNYDDREKSCKNDGRADSADTRIGFSQNYGEGF